jgi:diaminohydroxyphosphoribosylaminopyrimidine deaminase / 5-amino-6-(5-phosphoribosylamino)uracil reductase
MNPEQAMRRALELAEQALFITSPNPSVGCVILNSQGELLGEGHTQIAGQAHAEVMALRDVQAKGHTTKGAQAYVTLEPCSHQGRTGPCSQALIEAGIAKVHIALADPNPLVAGRGIQALKLAGVEVEIEKPDSPWAEQARALNLGFLQRMKHGQPWVRLKVAASLDGRTALPNGQSQWITSEAARSDGHYWRARACAVLTGVGTVLADDPSLNVRAVHTTRQPQRVVLDSKLRSPAKAKIFKSTALSTHASDQTWLYAAQAPADFGSPAFPNADLRYCPNAEGRVDLAAVLKDLATRGINELHIEAGAELNAAFLQTGLVDEILMYIAPQILGEGRAIARLAELDNINDAPLWQYHDVRQVGRDLRVLLRRPVARFEL